MSSLVRCFSTALRHHASKQALQTVPTKYLGRPSNNLSVGIVGLANVGKSTLFQAITNTTLGNPANYPFATILPEKSQVIVESEQLNFLSELYSSKKKIPSPLTIFDIAGLTKNASSGEGLGNKFLSDIRQVDGILHVVRGFRNDEIIHIEENKVDPIRDLVIVNDELILKDLEFVETGVEISKKSLKRPYVDKGKVHFELDTLDKVQDLLYNGTKISEGEWSDEEIAIINTFNFLTAKPTIILMNVNEDDYLHNRNEFKDDVTKWIKENSPKDTLVLFSASHESIASNERSKKSAIPTIVNLIRRALHIISFYTCGPIETRQWSLREGSTAAAAAGVIHTDLEKNFISAQVYKYDDLLVESPPLNESNLKKSGKQLKYGKAYLVEDNDVLLIKAVGAKPR